MAPKLVPEQYCRKTASTSPIDSAALIVISPAKVDLERQRGRQYCRVTSHTEMGHLKGLYCTFKYNWRILLISLCHVWWWPPYAGWVAASFFADSTHNNVAHLRVSTGQSIWGVLNTIMSSGRRGWRGKRGNKGGCFNYCWQIYFSVCL